MTETTYPTTTALFDVVSAHAKRDDLARLVHDVALRAAAARSRDPRAFFVAPSFSADEAQSAYGNPLNALEHGPTSHDERLLLGVLLAQGIALAPPSGVEAEDGLASALLWLAGHTPLNAFPALDTALGDRSTGLWAALTDLVRRIDAGREPSFDRADALVGMAALNASKRSDVNAAARKLADEVGDAALREPDRAAHKSSLPPSAPLVGELEPAPRGPIVTTLLAVTGLLFVLRASRLFAKLALARRAPAELEVTADALHIRSRHELLGKVMRESENVVPAAGLVRAAREVRYPRLALYAGLLALALGSYVGVELFVDGARAASPSLLANGLLIVALGVGLELALATLFPGSRGQCRLIVTARDGQTYCVGQVDVAAADRTLARLAQMATG